MTSGLYTPSAAGRLNFIELITTLFAHSGRDLPEVERILSSDHRSLNSAECEVLALAHHETTHFLDATTTIWGLEFALRKLRVLDAMKANKPYEDLLRVFMLNQAELSMHDRLVKTNGEVVPSGCPLLRHRLVYDESYGPHVMIEYMHGDQIMHEAPLSMLSLLEAHATSQEFLVRFSCIDAKGPSSERTVERVLTTRQYTAMHDDRSQLEYTVLLRLVDTHFPELSIQERLQFIAALCRFSLDLDVMALSAFANIVESSSRNEVVGHALAMDLRRGMSRHMVFFKTVLMLYDRLANSTEDERDAYFLGRLRDAPLEAIEEFWRGKGVLGPSWLSQFEYDQGVAEVLSHGSFLGCRKIFDGAIENRETLKNVASGPLDLRKLWLLDIFLDDMSIAKVPKRVDIDLNVHIDDEVLRLVGRFERIYSESTERKFHVPNIAFAQA